MNGLTRSAVAGSATGCRTMTGLAALTLATPALSRSQPDRALSSPWAKGALSLLALGEDIADKLPSTPVRLAPPGIIGRIAVGALTGVVIDRREAGRTLDAPGRHARADPAVVDPTASTISGLRTSPTTRTVVCALVGTAAAVGAAFAGAQWRAWAADRFGTDWVGAVIEDVATTALAALAALALESTPLPTPLP